LDALVSTKAVPSQPIGGNPFAGSSAATVANPFQAAKPAALTINQLRSQTNFTGGDPLAGLGSLSSHGFNLNQQTQPLSNQSASFGTGNSNPFSM
jgi:hypothetical protein